MRDSDASNWFRIGNFSVCIYFHPTLKVAVFRRGGDFIATGKRAALATFQKLLGEHLIVKNRGILGPRRDLGNVEEILIPNRIIRWCPADQHGGEHIEYEADPRHAEIFCRQMGVLMNAKGVTSPRV
jgi:hypothetical protein